MWLQPFPAAQSLSFPTYAQVTGTEKLKGEGI